MQDRIEQAIKALTPGAAMMGSTGNVVLTPAKAEEIIGLIGDLGDAIDKLKEAQDHDHAINRTLKESLDRRNAELGALQDEIGTLWRLVGFASVRLLEAAE